MLKRQMIPLALPDTANVGITPTLHLLAAQDILDHLIDQGEKVNANVRQVYEQSNGIDEVVAPLIDLSLAEKQRRVIADELVARRDKAKAEAAKKLDALKAAQAKAAIHKPVA